MYLCNPPPLLFAPLAKQLMMCYIIIGRLIFPRVFKIIQYYFLKSSFTQYNFFKFIYIFVCINCLFFFIAESIPSHGYTTICLFRHLLTDIWVDTSFWISQIKLLWTLLYKSFYFWDRVLLLAQAGLSLLSIIIKTCATTPNMYKSLNGYICSYIPEAEWLWHMTGACLTF
jgi:hypothetical protein